MGDKQRDRKMKISDALTLAMGRVGWLALLALLFVGAPVYGLWALFGQFDQTGLRWLAVGLAVCLLPAFGLGFFFGKMEVRGFLGGFDRALDGLAQAVDLRDRSKERRAAAAVVSRPTVPAPGALNVYLPAPTITQRALTQDEIIEL